MSAVNERKLFRTFFSDAINALGLFMEMHNNGVETRRQLQSSTRAPGLAGQLFLFARNWVKHPNMVGWMLPSSPFLVNEVLKQVDWDKARVIVEYGPGVGTFTTEVLKRMRPGAKLIALEIHPDFFKFLGKSLRAPRLHLLKESA